MLFPATLVLFLLAGKDIHYLRFRQFFQCLSVSSPTVLSSHRNSGSTCCDCYSGWSKDCCTTGRVLVSIYYFSIFPLSHPSSHSCCSPFYYSFLTPFSFLRPSQSISTFSFLFVTPTCWSPWLALNHSVISNRESSESLQSGKCFLIVSIFGIFEQGMLFIKVTNT